MEMAENGITGWRLQAGVIVRHRYHPVRSGERYQVAPDRVDGTTVSLSIHRLTGDDMQEVIRRIERAAKGEHQ